MTSEVTTRTSLGCREKFTMRTVEILELMFEKRLKIFRLGTFFYTFVSDSIVFIYSEASNTVWVFYLFLKIVQKVAVASHVVIYDIESLLGNFIFKTLLRFRKILQTFFYFILKKKPRSFKLSVNAIVTV